MMGLTYLNSEMLYTSAIVSCFGKVNILYLRNVKVI